MREYCIKDFRPISFFRNSSIEKLEELFHCSNVDIKNITDLQDDEIIPYLNKECENFPEELKDNLVKINNIANKEGMPYLIEACLLYNIDYKDLTAYDLAINLFIKNRAAFDFAYNWLNIDQYQNFKDFLGVEPKEVNLKNLEKFKQAISDYLKEQSKGRHVHFDEYPKDNKTAYIISYEDYLKPINKFEDNNLVTIKERPVKELVLIYYPNLAKLKCKMPNKELQDTIKSLFAEYMLDDTDFFNHSKVDSLFDLNVLAAKDKELIPNPKYGIEKVNITSLRASLSSDGLFKSDFRHPNELIKKLKEINLNIENIKILKAGIQFVFEGTGRSKSRTIYITAPNASTISDNPKDEIITKCLVDWEIASA